MCILSLAFVLPTHFCIAVSFAFQILFSVLCLYSLEFHLRNPWILNTFITIYVIMTVMDTYFIYKIAKSQGTIESILLGFLVLFIWELK